MIFVPRHVADPGDGDFRSKGFQFVRYPAACFSDDFNRALNDISGGAISRLSDCFPKVTVPIHSISLNISARAKPTCRPTMLENALG
jgi:hypothetical protein